MLNENDIEQLTLQRLQSGSLPTARASVALRSLPPDSEDNFVFGFKPGFHNTSLILFSNRQPSACSNLA